MGLTGFLVFMWLALGTPADSGTPVQQNDSARKLMKTKCGRCHKLYDPARYSAEDWKLWLDKMHKKVPLTREQYETLLRSHQRTATTPATQTSPSR